MRKFNAVPKVPKPVPHSDAPVKGYPMVPNSNPTGRRNKTRPQVAGGGSKVIPCLKGTKPFKVK